MALWRNLFLASAFALASVAAAEAQNPLRTIVIDPGHGGKDPGTVNGKIYEKDIVLDVALRLGEMIKKEMPELKVVYTRSTDMFVELSQRGRIANDAKADLFLSIHVNATEAKEGPSGALTLIMGRENEDSNLDMARRENDVISYEDDYKTTYKEYLAGSSEMFIIYSLMQYVNIDKSIVLGNLLQGRFKADTPMPDRGLRRQKLLVLWYTTMPGVLVELGFMNNTHDRTALTSERGKEKMARAMFDALRDYADGRTEPLTVTVPAPTKPAAATKPAATAADDNSVVYMVQILSATKKAARRELKDYAGSVDERRDGGRWRYYVGRCTTYSEAVDLLADVRRLFPGAFLVAMRGDRQIAIPEARAISD